MLNEASEEWNGRVQFPSSGASSGRATPLPISNRAVKPTSADDTPMHVGGKVGQCQFNERRSARSVFRYKKTPRVLGCSLGGGSGLLTNARRRSRRSPTLRCVCRLLAVRQKAVGANEDPSDIDGHRHATSTTIRTKGNLRTLPCTHWSPPYWNERTHPERPGASYGSMPENEALFCCQVCDFFFRHIFCK